MINKDYLGHSWVTTPAPSLKFTRKTSPSEYGIDYPFVEQTAQGVALFTRFPKFTLQDRKIHVSGPWYNSWSANQHFTRGITSISAMPNFRVGTAPTDLRQLPYTKKHYLMGDPFFWGHAEALANELEKQNPNDDRIAPLRKFHKEHLFSPHREAFLTLGARAWEQERIPTDYQRNGVMYPCFDIEATGGWEYQRQCFGWLYEGYAQAALRGAGIKVCPITYGQYTFEVSVLWASAREGGHGLPEYLQASHDCFRDNDPTIKTVNDFHGVLSTDGYIRAVWGEEPLYKRDARGKLILKDGVPQFSELASTKVYGQSITLEPGEAEHCLQDLYVQATRLYLMHHWIAGGYPSDSRQKRPHLSNSLVGAWTRISNEGVSGIQQNDRPLPSWQLDMVCGMSLFAADHLVMWASEFNTLPGAPGSDFTNAWKYNAHGAVEFIVKAAHRYSVLDPIHSAPFKWCWFDLPMVAQNKTDGDRFDQKPIIMGKIRQFKGKPWLEMWAGWPAADNQPSTFVVWVEMNGKKSPEWRIKLKNGRSYYLDAWQLPDQFAKAEGQHVHVRFTDQLGVTRHWQGDWRQRIKPA